MAASSKYFGFSMILALVLLVFASDQAKSAQKSASAMPGNDATQWVGSGFPEGLLQLDESGTTRNAIGYVSSAECLKERVYIVVPRREDWQFSPGLSMVARDTLYHRCLRMEHLTDLADSDPYVAVVLPDGEVLEEFVYWDDKLISKSVNGHFMNLITGSSTLDAYRVEKLGMSGKSGLLSVYAGMFQPGDYIHYSDYFQGYLIGYSYRHADSHCFQTEAYEDVHIGVTQSQGGMPVDKSFSSFRVKKRFAARFARSAESGGWIGDFDGWTKLFGETLRQPPVEQAYDWARQFQCDHPFYKQFEENLFRLISDMPGIPAPIDDQEEVRAFSERKIGTILSRRDAALARTNRTDEAALVDIAKRIRIPASIHVVTRYSSGGSVAVRKTFSSLPKDQELPGLSIMSTYFKNDKMRFDRTVTTPPVTPRHLEGCVPGQAMRLLEMFMASDAEKLRSVFESETMFRTVLEKDIARLAIVACTHDEGINHPHIQRGAMLHGFPAIKVRQAPTGIAPSETNSASRSEPHTGGTLTRASTSPSERQPTPDTPTAKQTMTTALIPAELIQLAQQYDNGLPKMLDSDTQLDSVIAGENGLIMNHTLVNFAFQQVAGDFETRARRPLKQLYCNKSWRAFRDRGYFITYNYSSKEGRKLPGIVFRPSDC